MLTSSEFIQIASVCIFRHLIPTRSQSHNLVQPTPNLTACLLLAGSRREVYNPQPYMPLELPWEQRH